jgi:hypothetical protein
MTTPSDAKVTIPLSVGDIYNVLCPDCQKAVVELVSAKAGPELLRQAIASQFASRAHPEPVEGTPGDPR